MVAARAITVKGTETNEMKLSTTRLVWSKVERVAEDRC